MNKYKNRFRKATAVAALTFLCGVAAIASGASVTQSVNLSAAACPSGVSWQATCS
jgi:hypothetical protein